MVSTQSLNLKNSGFDIERIGFTDHFVELHTHRDKFNDKVLGDVVHRVRIGNPVHPSDVDKETLTRKSEQLGAYPWLPEDCFDRTFTPIERVETELHGTQYVKGESVKGCRFCRERASRPNQIASEAVVAADSPVDSEESAEPTDLVETATPPQALKCPLCEWKGNTHDGRGIAFSEKQLQRNLKLHSRRQHEAKQ